MTDEMDLAPVVRSWFTETLPPASESSHVFDAAIREARKKRQQRHPWPPLPLPSTRPSVRDRVHDHKAQTAAATDTTEYQPRPSPIPATNGHAPTVIGRTQTMFSPVKAITVGALVFAVGGVFLVAQPFDQPGSVPGAEQGAEPPPRTVGVVVTFSDTPDSDPDPCTIDEGGVETCIWISQSEATDPRLNGTVTHVVTEYHDNLDTLSVESVEIVNDEGRWVGTGVGVWGPRTIMAMYTLTGEEAYEGVAAYLIWDQDNYDDDDGPTPFRGFTIEGELPPFPEPIE